MSRLFLSYINHILDEAKFIFKHTQELNRSEFLTNEIILKACIRSLEIIGEASKRIPNEIRQKYSKIPWKEMSGTRDKLIHDYFGIDYDILWDIVNNEIPFLISEIKTLLKKES